MIDIRGREIEYLRISVTRECNLNCVYCRPEAANCVEQKCESLSPDDFHKIVSIMAGLGIKKIRLTGGEPLVRSDINEILQGISTINGITDISMTTNGLKLADMAVSLKASGLKRVNISLDSLKPEKYKAITGSGKLEKVTAGIKAALEAGLYPIRINTVLIRGVNDDEIDDLLELARALPVDVRFIELMPFGKFGEDNQHKIIYSSEIISSRPQLVALEEVDESIPASYFTINGFKGRIGFISPVSHRFCSSCNRIRLTCDGKLKPCLGDNSEIDLLPALRNNSNYEELEKLIIKTIYEKPEGHNFYNGFKPNRNMDQIGG